MSTQNNYMVNSKDLAMAYYTPANLFSPLDARQKIYMYEDDIIDNSLFNKIKSLYPHLRVHVHKKLEDGNEICVGVYEIDEIEVTKTPLGTIKSVEVKSFHQVYSTAQGTENGYKKDDNTPIDKDNYNEAYKNIIYYTSDTKKVYLNGEVYGGSATYNTQMANSTKMPNAVGGIKKGTTVGDLKGKSFSELFDALLFPTVLPVAGAISATIDFKDYTSPKAVGSAAPTAANFTTIFNRGKFTLNGVQQTYNVAGVATKESIYVNGIEANLPTLVPLGNTTYKYHVEYGVGDIPLDSSGNPRKDLQNTGGTIESVAVTLNGTYPFYIVQNGTKTEKLSSCVVNGTKGWKITLSTSNDINIESTAAGALEIIVPGTLTALRMVDPFSATGYSDMLGDFKEVEMNSTELANYPSGTEYTKYVSTIVFGTRKIYSGTIEIVESK